MTTSTPRTRGVSTDMPESPRPQAPAPQRSSEWGDRNPELRREYLAVESAIAEAELAGDNRKVRRLRNRLDDIGREFVELNRGLVVSEAKRFNRNTTDDQDNTRAAELGLWEAFTKFDPDRGVAFSTFSRQYIAGGVQRSVRRNEFQHLSQTEFNLRKQLRLAESQLMFRLGRNPTKEELSLHSGVPLEKVKKILAPVMASLDAPTGEDDFVLGDRLEAALQTLGDDTSVEEFVECLSDLELWVIMQRSGMVSVRDVSLSEVADGIGIGREVARRAETRARVRIAASVVADQRGRLAEPDEIGELLRIDAEQAALFNVTSFEDLRDRMLRLFAARSSAGSPRARALYEERIDRCGEEFMAMVAENVYDASGRYLDQQGRPVGLECATRLVWEAFRCWVPGGKTFPRHMRDHLGARHPRSKTFTEQRTLPPDELWYMVRDQRTLV